MEIDVVGLQHGVPFQLSAPVPIGVLLGKNEVPRPCNRRFHIGRVRVDPPKARRRGPRPSRPWGRGLAHRGNRRTGYPSRGFHLSLLKIHSFVYASETVPLIPGLVPAAI